MNMNIGLTGAVVIGALLTTAGSVAGQATFRSRTHPGLGFTVNAPTQILGFNVLAFGPAFAGWGGYADAKFTRESPKNEDGFVTDITVAQAEGFDDQHMASESEWTTVNAAVVRVVSDALALYGGAGYSKEKAYRRYFDETSTRGLFGTYWIEDPDASGARVNVLGGAFFRATQSFVLQFGFEAQPRGFTVGASYILPFGR
jgi:hypothetical protein